MVATKINIVIEQGASFHMVSSLTEANGSPTDTSVYTSRAQLRKSPYSNTSYDFTVTLSNGSITLDMSANTTALLEPGRYGYDAYLYSSNASIRIIEGLATVTGEYTK